MIAATRRTPTTLDTADMVSEPRARRLPAGVDQGPAARILSAASALLFENGVDGLTTDRLSRQAQVSTSSLDKHFPDLSLQLEAVIAGEAERIRYGMPQESASVAGIGASHRHQDGTHLAHR